MFARLWWKDVRQFWPIWAILAVAAAGCQVLMLKYGGQDARSGMLLPVAMGWGLLYAFAVSTAAFAGERENNTLGFLDMLPVSRKVLWGGKASFAVVTTVVFAVALAAMAWLGTDRPFARWLGYSEYANFDPNALPLLGKALVVVAVLAVFLEVLGWGLFWSAVLSNAMIAVVLAIVCSSLTLVITNRYQFFYYGGSLVGPMPLRLVLFLATSAASALVLTLGGRPARSWDEILTREVAVGPLAVRRRHREERAPRRLMSPQVKALIWQSMREVWPVWWRLMAIGFVLPFVCLVVGLGADLGVVNLLNQGLAVVAGVSVFGIENRNNAQRFLAHHGARPGVVWAVKVAVWVSWFVTPWFLLWLFTMVASSPGQRADWAMSLVITMTSASVGLVAGMAIRRGITAGLVAVVAVFALGIPQVTLANWQMLPYVVPVLVPLALVVVSWAWSADWMLERPGVARYGRLGLLLAVALGGVFGAYVSIRVTGVPDVGPGFDVAAFKRAAAVDDRDNAAPLYNEAVQRTLVVSERGAAAHNPGGPVPVAGVEERRDERKEVLELIRRASALPRCQFVRIDRATVNGEFNSRHVGASSTVGWVLSESVKERRERGDLAGAWDNLMVMFRVARHLSGPVPIGESYMGLNTERNALGLALEWAADPRQTPERLRAALGAYRALPPMPPLIETIRAESILVENTLNLPADDMATVIAGYIARGATEFEKTASDFHLAAITSPWEVARARRAFRLLFGAIGQHASTNPTARPGHEYFGWDGYVVGSGPEARRLHHFELKQLEETTPLAQWFLPARGSLTDLNDRNEVARRALVLVLALRHWQVTHDGKLPVSLDDLISSDELDHLPTDPYANGKPFHYIRAGSQRLLPLGRLEPWWPLSHEDKERIQLGHGRLLYSIGPDLHDDQASQDVDSRTGFGDLIFPLTEAGAGPK